MRVFVADDDQKILTFIVNGLKQEGYMVDSARDGEEAWSILSTRMYDAAVLDIMMPKLDGLTVIQRIRDEGVKTPILILSAKHEVDDRVSGLKVGGDDYLVKPFAFSELAARLQSLIRRSRGTSDPTSYTIGDLSIDLLKHEARRGAKFRRASL